jgi:fimbrial chaperone protein
MSGSPAAALSLIPIAQDFEPSGREATQTFRLQNDTDKEVAVAIGVMTREISIDGQETNNETQDFVVFPRNALIGPRQTQMVRVQWRGPAAAKELAYRIIAEQLPIKASLDPNARAIQIVVRYVGSLYVVPPGGRPDLQVDSARAAKAANDQRMLEVVLQNRGRAHTLIDEPRLQVSAGGETHSLNSASLRTLQGENVLAESKRRFLIPWPGDLPFEKPDVKFEYTPLR